MREVVMVTLSFQKDYYKKPTSSSGVRFAIVFSRKRRRQGMRSVA